MLFWKPFPVLCYKNSNLYVLVPVFIHRRVPMPKNQRLNIAALMIAAAFYSTGCAGNSSIDDGGFDGMVLPDGTLPFDGALPFDGGPCGHIGEYCCLSGMTPFCYEGTCDTGTGTCVYGGDGGAEDGGTQDAGTDAGTDAGSEPCINHGGTLGWMCPVAGGKFNMGCAPGDNDCHASDESPYHEVTVQPFRIDKREVTAGQYKACVDDVWCTAPGTGGSCTYGISGWEDTPVNCVTWKRRRKILPVGRKTAAL
jgi:hypothetical protein